MKKLIFLLTIGLSLSASLTAQTLNWGSLKPTDRHILNANAGLDFGTTFGIGYGYHIDNKLFPLVLQADLSVPSGSRIAGDFKTRIGGQVNWIDYHHLRVSTKLQCVFRRTEFDFVRLVNFGSDFSGTVGYYRLHWFVAGEVGFDKAIVTNFRHSQAYRDQYADVVDGWYQPPTGGNFYYGLQAGVSFGKNDIYLRTGKLISQDFRSAPLLPFYFQLGYNLKFGTKLAGQNKPHETIQAP